MQHQATSKRLIIFFIPPEKIVNGGVLSIFSICKVSREFKNIHEAEVVLCTYPGTPSYKKNDLFENDETIYTFDELLKRGVPEYLQLHVPEYASYDTFMALKQYSNYINAVPDLRVNIMNQNILLMQRPIEVANWFSLTPHVTQTTAHKKYTTQALADKYYLPTLHLSTYLDQGQYTWVPFEKKNKIIALSPDKTEARDLIVSKLKKHLPDYKIITIQNMSYEEYKLFVSRAKFLITFGEGFDGYFLEAFFSGGITFSVYNEAFFPDKEFATFENLYSSYDDMQNRVSEDIKRYDNKNSYEKIVRKNLGILNALYQFSAYKENIKNFYLGKFSYMPEKGSGESLIGDIIQNKDTIITGNVKHIVDLEALSAEKEEIINRLSEVISDKEKLIQVMLNSYSWRITKPLRQARSPFKRKR